MPPRGGARASRYAPEPVGSLVEQTEDVLVDTRGYIYVTNKNQGLWISTAAPRSPAAAQRR